MNFNRVILAAAGGAVASFFSGSWQMVLFVFIAVMLDFITGLVAGRATEGLKKEKSTKGLYKKMGFMLLLVTGMFLDWAFTFFLSHGFNIDITFNMPISLMCAIWIVVTEAISICENLERTGVAIPKPVIKLLRKTQENIDDT